MFRVWLGTADHKVVGDFLGDLRREAGVTQDELALRLKKPQSFVSSYERGQRRIDFIEFTTIMRALDRNPVETGTNLLKAIADGAKSARRAPKRAR